MVCIYCGSKTQVINSRLQKKPNQTWRRRQCLSCGAIFTTLEGADLYGSLLYTNGAGRSEPFSRDQLLVSIYDSLKHRKDALPAATALTETVLSKLLPQIDHASLTREQIIKTTAEVLKRFDKAGAVTYEAYHPA